MTFPVRYTTLGRSEFF